LSVRAILGATGLLLALHGTAAIACGHCIEDKVAAVYDHAILMKAFSQKHHVAFFAINGTLAASVGTRRSIKAIAESAYGVDKGSARVSVESASLSVAFDPQRVSVAALQRALEQKLAATKLSLLPLRVMDQPAKMNAVDGQ
jgi:hypothetical protein